jgi:hypothetical protein
MLAIGGTFDHAGKRARCRQHALELQAGHNVRIATIAVLRTDVAGHRLQPRREQHGTHIEIDNPLALVVHDRSSAANEDALIAFRAHAAAQAARGLGARLLLGKRRGDFQEVVAAFSRGAFGDLSARSERSGGYRPLARLTGFHRGHCRASLLGQRLAAQEGRHRQRGLVPAAIAVTMKDVPTTASPPANTPGTSVASVSGST